MIKTMGHNILIIDDEIDICETIHDVLEGVADKIFMAQNADDALKILDSEKVHLVLSDIMMPKMTGIEMLKILRQRRFAYPLIFISASDSEQYLAQALEYGAADFISKPCDSQELIALVKRLLSAIE